MAALRWTALAVLLAVQAAPSPAAARETRLRVVLVHGGELLRSEQRSVDRLRQHLAKRHAAVEVVAADEAEAARVRAAFAGKDGTPPAAWQGASAVLAIEVLPPSGQKKGERVARGLGSIVLWRPPFTDPVYSERVDSDAPAFFDAERVGKWIDALLALGGSR